MIKRMLVTNISIKNEVSIAVPKFLCEDPWSLKCYLRTALFEHYDVHYKFKETDSISTNCINAQQPWNLSLLDSDIERIDIKCTLSYPTTWFVEYNEKDYEHQCGDTDLTIWELLRDTLPIDFIY